MTICCLLPFFRRHDFSSDKANFCRAKCVPMVSPTSKPRDAMYEYSSPLYGFWTEQGSRDGIMLYANEKLNILMHIFYRNRIFQISLLERRFRKYRAPANFQDSQGIIFNVLGFGARFNPICLCHYKCKHFAKLRNGERIVLEYEDEGFYLTLTPIKKQVMENGCKKHLRTPKISDHCAFTTSLYRRQQDFFLWRPFFVSHRYSRFTEFTITEHNAKRKLTAPWTILYQTKYCQTFNENSCKKQK